MSTDSGQSPARKKPVRRVRVIEVIEDDEELDLDAVLSELDEADAAEEAVDEAAEAEEKPAPRPKPVRKPAAKKPPTPPAAGEDEDGEDEDPPTDPAAGGAALPRPVIAIIALAGALALVSSGAIWEWSKVSKLEAAKADRKAATKAATEFGASIFTYDADHIQQQLDHTASLMTGDMQQRYIKNESSIKDNFTTKNAGMKLSAKATKVYVGDVNGKFVTAMIQLDATISTSGTSAPSSGAFVLTLAKVKGQWKVSDMATTDSTDPTGSSTGVGGLTGLGGGATPTPAASASASPTASK